MNGLHLTVGSFFRISSGWRTLPLLLLLVITPFSECPAEELSRSVRPPSQRPAAVSSEVGVGDLYAVCVGVAKYAHPNIRTLKVADKDARDFAGFLQTQTDLFRETHITLLVNEKATHTEVKDHLFNKLPRAGKNDTVVLFFAGHGTDDQNQPGEFFFLTHDANLDNLEGTAVNMDLGRALKRLDSKRILVIADTCFSGGFSGEGTRSVRPSLGKIMNQFRESEGTVFLSSSRPDEISKEQTERGNGVFTYFLLEGLKGKADLNGDGIVTFREAYEYVYEKAKNATNGAQHPQYKGRLVGEFPLSFAPVKDSERSPLTVFPGGGYGSATGRDPM